MRYPFLLILTLAPTLVGCDDPAVPETVSLCGQTMVAISDVAPPNLPRATRFERTQLESQSERDEIFYTMIEDHKPISHRLVCAVTSVNGKPAIQSLQWDAEPPANAYFLNMAHAKIESFGSMAPGMIFDVPGYRQQ